MPVDTNPQFLAVREALPAALMIWKLGTRLMQRAQGNPRAQLWARVGLAGAALLAAAGVAVSLANTASQRAEAQHLADRLDDEIWDSFPASDPPSVSRSGGNS